MSQISSRTALIRLKTPISVNALKNVKILNNVHWEPIALMEAVEDINASMTETALVEEWSATVMESVFRKEEDQDLDLDQDPDQGIIQLPVSHP